MGNLSFNKYRENMFIFSIIEICDNNNLLIIEQKYINLLKPEYNICKNAFNRLGLKHSKKTKDKISKSNIGKKPWNKGLNYDKGFGKKHRHTEESKLKMVESSKGQNPWNKGKKDIYSEETKNKMGAKNIGRKPWNKGIPITKEVSEKISNKKNKNYLVINVDSKEEYNFSGCKSISDFLNVDRNKVYSALRRNKNIKGYTIKRV